MPPEFAQPLDKLPTPQLIDLHKHANNWIVRRARRILTERRDPEAILPLQTIARTSADPQLALEAFWTFASCGGLSEKTAPRFLQHANPLIRRWTVQFLGDEPALSPSLASRLAQLAQTEPDVEVRTLLACTARRLPTRQALPILESLLLRGEDQTDPYQPLLLWWGIEQHSLPARQQLVDWLCSPQTANKALVYDTIVPRLMRRYAAEGTFLGLHNCAQLLQAFSRTPARDKLLPALDQGLGECAELPDLAWHQLPSGLQLMLDSSVSNTTDSALLRIGLRFQYEPALRQTRNLVRSSSLAGNTATDIQLHAIRNLAEFGGSLAVQTLLPILRVGDGPAQRQLAVIDGLQRFPDDRISAALIKRYPDSQDPVKQRIVQALLSRPEWATAFLQEFLDKRFDTKDLKAEDWQTIITDLPEPARDQIVKTWGSVAPPTAEERLAEIRRFNNDLRAATGDPAAGKLVFGQHCAICHKLHGEGYNVGPDLTHVNRKDRDYLLVQLVDPGAIIRKEFLAYSVTTTDGRVAAGLLVQQNAAELTLMAAKEQKTTIPLADVDEIKESKASLMPENVLKQLKPQELRDLFSFLQEPP